MTGTISAQSLSGFPSIVAYGKKNHEKSQKKYPSMASTLTVNMSMPKLLSRMDNPLLKRLRHTQLKTFEMRSCRKLFKFILRMARRRITWDPITHCTSSPSYASFWQPSSFGLGLWPLYSWRSNGAVPPCPLSALPHNGPWLISCPPPPSSRAFGPRPFSTGLLSSPPS